MQPTFCILQDIRTGAIIGRGTERQGLYYVDELTTGGTVMLAHGTSEREAWLWHRRLGHPSGSYLYTLFPKLFPLNKPISCETCILAKSHRQTFKPSNTRVKVRFSLIHSDVWGPAPVIGGQRVPPKRYSPEKESRGSTYPIANIAKGNLSEEAKAFALSMYSNEIPANTKQALKSKHWKDAMEEEINALIKNNTWEKRVLPSGKKTVGCRWVFTIKYKPDGTIERYKARLLAKGHTQTYGIDYSKTFSPVAKIKTIGVLISIAANKGWPLHQFDVKNAFLHGELKEEIYMEAPRGFTDRNDKEEITKLKKNLFTEFEMKDLGRLKYFLGIEVLRSKQGIFMYQKKYVLDLLAEIGMVDCKPADTPMIVNQKLYMEKKACLADKGRYQRMVGKLISLSHTRPDIAHVVGVVSKFMHQPQKAHMKAILRIIRYLKGTAGHRVLFKQNGHIETQLYTDADWAGDKGDRRSTLGYLTLVGGNLVMWRSKKQKAVALLSAEAEFRGIARGITKVLWIQKLLT
ncbi:putative RNA-directed DNA polymerase [Tanacetum coccineum]|uniref:RNA-directed DNA polymerase n=1 Tax=Tanacetum coccineum TaxID=301880 RepID=A0ABQ5B2M6_9ASTR